MAKGVRTELLQARTVPKDPTAHPKRARSTQERATPHKLSTIHDGSPAICSTSPHLGATPLRARREGPAVQWIAPVNQRTTTLRLREKSSQFHQAGNPVVAEGGRVGLAEHNQSVTNQNVLNWWSNAGIPRRRPRMRTDEASGLLSHAEKGARTASPWPSLPKGSVHAPVPVRAPVPFPEPAPTQ